MTTATKQVRASVHNKKTGYFSGNANAPAEVRFLSLRTMKRLVAELLVARKKWMAEPRVRVQAEPVGHA